MPVSFFAVAAAAAAQAAAPAPAAAPAAVPAEAAQAAPAAALTPSQARFIAAGTQVSLAATQELSSKHVKEGEHYQFTVVSDVTDNGTVVIPRGSIATAVAERGAPSRSATGTITMQTGRAIGGKSGKFDVTFEKVEANGVTFPLMGTHRQEGKGNTVGALLGSILISGRSAVMLPGQVVTAMVKEKTAY